MEEQEFNLKYYSKLTLLLFWFFQPFCCFLYHSLKTILVHSPIKTLFFNSEAELLSWLKYSLIFLLSIFISDVKVSLKRAEKDIKAAKMEDFIFHLQTCYDGLSFLVVNCILLLNECRQFFVFNFYLTVYKIELSMFFSKSF